ncbi:MAG TPA: twitching motility protein PilT, partial [Acidimicrobiia bacterium]|nr:twitching motility protein PilT [Acidimicrobiia bacterium]
MGRASLRFYAELCDLVGEPSGRVERAFVGSPGVKDLIESCGVPHTEIDLVLVNGEPVDFSHRITDGDRISVYPVFEAFDVGEVSDLRSDPLRDTRFVLDVHLGK